MWPFNGVKNTYKKSEAAVIAQNILEMSEEKGWFERSPAKAANDLVQNVWEAFPDIFEGRFGQRPHKIAAAASAFNLAINSPPEDNEDRRVYIISLAQILSEIAVNGNLYPFNSLDVELFDNASKTMEDVMVKFEASAIGKEMASLLGETNI